MAGESRDLRARAARSRAANVPGGRPHRLIVKLSEAERAALAGQAAEAGGISVQRLLVETALGKSASESGRAAAVRSLLELDTELRRIGNNLNQLTRYAHQDRELGEGIGAAVRAVARAALSVDATARWVLEQAPAVSDDHAPDVSDLAEEFGALDAAPEDFA